MDDCPMAALFLRVREAKTVSDDVVLSKDIQQQNLRPPSACCADHFWQTAICWLHALPFALPSAVCANDMFCVRSYPQLASLVAEACSVMVSTLEGRVASKETLLREFFAYYTLIKSTFENDSPHKAKLLMEMAHVVCESITCEHVVAFLESEGADDDSTTTRQGVCKFVSGCIYTKQKNCIENNLLTLTRRKTIARIAENPETIAIERSQDIVRAVYSAGGSLKDSIASVEEAFRLHLRSVEQGGGRLCSIVPFIVKELIMCNTIKSLRATVNANCAFIYNRRAEKNSAATIQQSTETIKSASRSACLLRALFLYYMTTCPRTFVIVSSHRPTVPAKKVATQIRNFIDTLQSWSERLTPFVELESYVLPLTQHCSIVLGRESEKERGILRATTKN